MVVIRLRPSLFYVDIIQTPFGWGAARQRFLAEEAFGLSGRPFVRRHIFEWLDQIEHRGFDYIGWCCFRRIRRNNEAPKARPQILSWKIVYQYQLIENDIKL